MRISAVALCTLAALTAKDLTSIAIANPLAPTPSPDSDQAQATTPMGEPELIASITPPEQLAAEPLASRGEVIVDDAGEQAPNPVAIAPSTLSWVEASHIENTQVTNTPIAPPEPLLHSIQFSSTESVALAGMATGGVPTEAEAIAQPPSGSQAIAPIPTAEPESTAIDIPITLMAQAASTGAPSETEIEDLQRQLSELDDDASDFGNEFEGSPAITISNPSGFGADDGTGFVSFGFQSETRYSDEADGSMGIGIGLGDAQDGLGVQVSYTIASFGSNRDFGTGGLNVKLHHDFSNGLSIAAGWEGLVVTGDVDFQDSIYGSVTQVIRTAPDLDDPFSRIAFTAGVGSGRFRSEDAIEDDDDTLGVFGSMAIRVARPVSAIVEWTGQDLAAGLSIAPFRDVPLVITPALRDIAGAGDGARFVVGAGFSFRF